MTNLLRNLVKDERGQDTIDCALLIGVLAVAVVAVFSGTGIGLKGMWASGIQHLDFITSAG